MCFVDTWNCSMILQMICVDMCVLLFRDLYCFKISMWCSKKKPTNPVNVWKCPKIQLNKKTTCGKLYLNSPIWLPSLNKLNQGMDRPFVVCRISFISFFSLELLKLFGYNNNKNELLFFNPTETGLKDRRKP